MSEHIDRAEEHAARAEAVFEDTRAPVEPYVEAMLATYELLLELLDRIPEP